MAKSHFIIVYAILLSILLCAPVHAEKAHFIWSDFTSGELSPLLDGQVNLDKYYSGAKRMENFLPLPQGPAKRRSGFKYIASTKNGATEKSRLVPFVFSDTQAYILEFGDQYIRFFKDGGQIQDPDANTLVLIHANEPDATAGTSIADTSSSARTITAVGNAQTDEDQKRFGNASVIFDQTGDWLTVPLSSDFDFSGGTFTFETWIRPDGAGGGSAGVIYSQAKAGAATDHVQISVDTSEKVTVAVVIGSSTEVSVKTQNAALTNDVWQHLAVVENGNDWFIFVDGVDKASSGNSDTDRIASTVTTPVIGADYDGTTTGSSPFFGWLDEIRISDTARYTANFVPQTVQHGDSGSSPLELTINVSYLEADLFGLQFAQSADVLYISHDSYPPRKLLRFSDTSWRLVDIEFLPEPLQDETRDAGLEITLGQATVGAGVAASDAGTNGTMFTTDDVGKEIREDGTVGDGRATVVAVADTDTATVDIFKAFSSTTPDANTWDFIGPGGTGELTITGNYGGGLIVNFGEVVTLTETTAGTPLNVFKAGDVGKFIVTDDSTGSIIYKILTFTSATAVNAVALETDTYDTNLVLTAGQWEIKKSAWSASDYPCCVSFFENRLLWAGSPSFPQNIWGSKVDDYENHTLGVADADAYDLILSGPQVNRITWMQPSDTLLIGTIGDEWLMGSRGADAPTTPTNVSARIQSVFGSAKIQPVGFGQVVLFLERGALKLRELAYDFDTDKYVSPDLTLLAEHITGDGIVEMAFTVTPFPIVWAVRSDGSIAALTYDRLQKVVAWHKHVTDGSFESVAVIPGQTEDELWAIVNRTISSTTARYVERMNPTFDETTLTNAFFVDSGVTYGGVSTTSITGLSHLEGESLQVLADGVVLGDETVSSGAITIDTAASDVHVGLPYTSILQTMRPELKDGKGTTQGREKRINKIVLRLNNAKQYKYGRTPTGTLKEKTHTSLFTGDTDPPLPFIQGTTPEAYVTIVQEEPLPITIISIIPEINVPN